MFCCSVLKSISVISAHCSIPTPRPPAPLVFRLPLTALLHSCDFLARSAPLTQTHSINANVRITLLFCIAIVNVLQLHGSAGWLIRLGGGQLYITFLQISCSIRMPALWKLVACTQSYSENNRVASFFFIVSPAVFDIGPTLHTLHSDHDWSSGWKWGQTKTGHWIATKILHCNVLSSYITTVFYCTNKWWWWWCQ